MENNIELIAFIQKHKYFWWWVSEKSLQKLNLSAIVEGTLSFGNVADIKELFELVGITQVADEFYQAIAQKRVNYQPRTVHFFDLYFKRHVPKYSNRGAKTAFTTHQPV